MQLIPVASSAAHPPGGPDGLALGALAGVIAAIGEADFGHTALAQLNRWMPLCWWSIYRLRADQPPTVHAAGSCGVRDGTGEAWRDYRAGLYRRDETFAAAREQVQGGQAVLTHWHARELPLAHRQQIYLRHGLRERLSIVQGDAPGGVLAINLYRHQDQAPFSDAAIDAMRLAAQPMLACVAKHLALAGRADREDPPVVGGAGGPDSLSVLSGLTPREHEVCARLLKGWTHEGIAADLQLSAATVKTYRDRAFRRLGIHHRNELFALVFESRP
jgi:DNA-binding CsgD family transcriptional regulator